MKKNNVVLLSCLLMVLAYSCSEEKHVEVAKQKSAETEENKRKINVQIVNLREQLSTLQKADIAQKEAISNLQKQVKELVDLGSKPVAQDQAIRDQLTLENHRLAALKEAKRIEELNLNARFGQLNPGMQSRVIMIAEKIKSGKDLDRLDITTLEKTNFGHEYIAEYYAKQGRKAAGSETIIEVFGPKRNKDDKKELNLNARLGQLSPGMQSRVIMIAENIKSGGEIGRIDVEILKEANFGHEFIDEYYAKQGRKAAGSETIIEVFGPKRNKDDKKE